MRGMMLLRDKSAKKVDKLYHYAKFNCERLAAVITQNKLYFCSPEAFNDPFDSKILFTSRR
jgi:hypothetical protein